MRHHHLLLAAATLIGTVACGPTAAVDPAENRAPVGAAVPVPITRLRVEPVSFTTTSGLRSPQRTVIRDAAAWRAAWAELSARVAPEPPLPAVDFASELVVLVALGERPTSGYQILVDSARTTADGGVVVHVRTISPAARCGVFQVLTQPVDLARLPSVSGPITFRDQAVVVDCP
jgi:hypothetical protein